MNSYGMNTHAHEVCSECRKWVRKHLVELSSSPSLLLIRCGNCSEPLGFVEKPRSPIAEYDACQILLRSFDRLHWRDRIFLAAFSRVRLRTPRRHEQFKRLAKRYGLIARIPADVF